MFCGVLHDVVSQHRCDGAGRRQPSPEAAHDTLCAALQEQASWEQRAHVAKELLHEMLKSRREAADLQQQYDIKCGPSAAASSMTVTAVNCGLPSSQYLACQGPWIDHSPGCICASSLCQKVLHRIANDHFDPVVMLVILCAGLWQILLGPLWSTASCQTMSC